MSKEIHLAIIGGILKTLSTQFVKELGLLWGVKNEINKLTNTVLTIQAELSDAEEQQTTNYSAKDWLEKLQDVLYDADDVLDEFFCEAERREVATRDKNAKMVRIFFSKSNQIVFGLKMAYKIKNVRERIDAIAADRNNFHSTEHLMNQNSSHVLFDEIRIRETHSFIREEDVIGRDDDKKTLKGLLLDMNVTHDVSFIAIVGMGGLGKTTLAKYLYNDDEVSKFFELRVWVCVSELFDVKIVVEKFLEAATESRPETRGLESLQSQLQKVIGGRKYLLVMDDIWNETENTWLNLKNLFMCGARGSKIVITKRDSKLSPEIADMTSVFPLEALSKRDSWFLFRKVAFKEGKEMATSNLKQIGKEILEKCRGVPLVIRSIGRLLYFRTSEEEWRTFMNNELLIVGQQENYMTSIIKLSYNYLTPDLKQCFAYCSLFPKHRHIHTNELRRQWVAQGFLQSSSNGRKSMEEIGNICFTELCLRFFLETDCDQISPDISVCYIHDMMHDLAKMVAGNRYSCRNSNDDDDVDEKIRHVSFDFMSNSRWDLPPSLFKVKGLRTFLLPRHSPYNRKTCNVNDLDMLFYSFGCLRVLDLKWLNIKKLPDSINKLRHLRYLDLTGNEDMELLPNSITELQNLQTLDLSYCYSLKELPRDTSNLVNLRHLDIFHSMHLTHMPNGMGRLTCLQTLDLFVLDKEKNKTRASKLCELNRLNSLRGHLKLICLEQLRATPSEATSANLKDKRDLRWLMLKWNIDNDYDEAKAASNDEIVLQHLEPNSNIEDLKILGYSGVRLSNWVSSLKQLNSIKIIDCTRLQHLPKFENLPHLKYLSLKGLTSLEFIENEHPSSSFHFFPSLENLQLKNIPNLKRWWRGESTMEHQPLPTFTRLTSITISNCPKLDSIPQHQLPLIEATVDEVGLHLLKLETETDTDIASSSTTLPPCSMLRSLTLTKAEDVKHLPVIFLQKLISLKQLTIKECDNFVASKEHCTFVSNPPIGIGKGIVAEEEDDDMELKLPQKLTSLRLKKLPKLESIPIELQHFTTLRKLYISNCSNLINLPEWIGSLVSLQEMTIVNCPRLKSLPERICELKYLYYLRIAGCPQLEERCKPGGEDWPNIAHIPQFMQCFFMRERDEAKDTNTAQTRSGAEPEDGIWRKMKGLMTNIIFFIFTCGEISSSS